MSGCDAVVIEEEVTDVAVAETTTVEVLETEAESVVVLEAGTEVVIPTAEVTEVVIPEDQAVEVIVVETGASTQQTTHLTEFITGGLYVGVAPKGAEASDAAWDISKIVEADDHPRKVPSAPGRYAWSDRATLTYVAG